MKFVNFLVALFVCAGMQSANGQAPNPSMPTPASEATVLAIKNQFDAQFIVAKINTRGTDVVAPGTVVTLRKENLVMNKVLLSNGNPSIPVDNVYENGSISTSGLLGALSKLNSVLGKSRADNVSRSFAIGDKLWVTGISVQTSGIEFRLLSDPIADQRLHAVLKFPISDETDVQAAIRAVGEVLVTDRPPVSVASAPAVSPVGDSSQRLQSAAQAGDVEAMYQLGNVLVQRGDNVNAVRWFERASEKGHVKATNALGFMLDEGRGAPQNYSRAAALYLRAMKAGNVDAMMNRGVLILNGNGPSKDPQLAYMHFLLAVAYAPDEDARNAAVKLKDDLSGKLSQQQIARSQSMADRFAKEEMRQAGVR